MPPKDVTYEEVDDAFYKSYGEGSSKGLDSRLIDPKTKKHRRLTLNSKDAEFRKCWMETRRVLRQKKSYKRPAKGVFIGPVLACPHKKVNTDRPLYTPSTWNDGGAIQGSTNCYAYAMNSRTGHTVGKTPQPGHKSKTPIALPFSCLDISNAVEKDGKPDDIINASQCPIYKKEEMIPPEKLGYYLVALVVTSKPHGYDASDGVFYYNDYHWYRQDRNGSWSHKPGTTPVTNIDSDGKSICNPQLANRRSLHKGKAGYIPNAGKVVDLVIDYDTFCGYFYVKKGGGSVSGS